MKGRPFVVLVVGRGKVGEALASALEAARVDVVRVSGRAILVSAAARPIAAQVAVIAVRDAQIAAVGAALAPRLARGTPVLHVAGSLGPEALASVAALGFPVAQMHPLLSFVSGGAPDLRGATLLVDGDPRAVTAGRRLARALGFVPRSYPRLPRPLYHAAAALLSNGAAALADAAARLLTRGGVRPRDAARMVAPLLASVARNVLERGLPQALSGPVRRGDRAALERHWQALRRESAAIRWLYLASVAAQVPMARALGEASPAALADVARWVQAVGVASPTTTRASRSDSGARSAPRSRSTRTPPKAPSATPIRAPQRPSKRR